MKTSNKNKVSNILKLIFSLIVFTALTLNLNAQPNEDWVKRLNKFDKDESVTAMTSDSYGFIYVTGYTEGKESGKDFLTVKLSPAGEEIWSAIYEGQENADGNDDLASSIAVDERGIVYVTGTTHGGIRGKDILTVKYDRDGVQYWDKIFSGSGAIEDSNEEGALLAIDSQGNVIMSCSSLGNRGYDFTLIKYSGKGGLLWSNTFDIGSGNDDIVKGMKIDSKDNIILTGVGEGISTNKDYLTILVSSFGELVWEQRYNGVGGNIAMNDDEVSSIVLDQYDNIYITGYSYGVGSGKDLLTVKYNRRGYEVWVSRQEVVKLKKGGVTEEEASAIAVDESGNVYLTGKVTSSIGETDIVTMKLNSKGDQDWSQTYNGKEGSFGEDAGNAIAIDAKGSVYVTGYISSFMFENSCGGNMDFVTLKYNYEGELKWVKEYNGAGRFEINDDVAKGIILDSRGGIFVIGDSEGEESAKDFCIIKYSEYNPYDPKTEDKTKLILNENYPNPFNPTTKISFSIPVSMNVRLAVFDISGREVDLLINGNIQAGIHEYEWNASKFSSGTYFYRIQSNEFVQTKKMTLIK